MKKSLVMLVVLVSSLALAGSVFAMGDWGCYTVPTCKKPPCVDQVLQRQMQRQGKTLWPLRTHD